MKFSDLTLGFRLLIPILIIVGGLAALSSVYNFYNIPQPVNIWMPGKEVTKIKYVKAGCPESGVSVYEKRKAVKEFELPDWVKDDANKEIAKVIEVDPYDGKTQIASIYDSKEGSIDMITKRIPLSLFQFESKIRIGGLFGFSTRDNDLTGQAWASYTFLRIGRIHAQIYGEAGRDIKGMVGAYGEW